MKNLSLALNGVLAVAVVILYILHFSSQSNTATVGANSEGSVASKSNYNVVYINVDSLMSNYELAKVKSQELKAETEKLSSSLQNRADGLQKEFQNFQRNAGNLTPNQARALQEDLAKKEQNLKQSQYNAQQTMLKMEQDVTIDINKRLKTYLEEIGSRDQLDYVISYGPGSPVLFATDTLDITNQVLDDLNARYKQEQDSIK